MDSAVAVSDPTAPVDLVDLVDLVDPRVDLAVQAARADRPAVSVDREVREATTPPIYSRDKQLVLMSLDMSDPATRAQAKEERDFDTGVSWIKNWGQGRMFYTNLGHGGNRAGLELENTPVLEHYLLGIQWALGDLKNVDATPKGGPKKN